MSNFNSNPYSSLDEDTFEQQDLYSDEDQDSLYDYDAEAEWEESKEQLNALFSLVIFPFVGKWLGKKFSFWVWSRYLTKTPFTTRFSITSTDMVNSIKRIA
ncbi:hypothetical protein BD770DRAFT_379604 [Pilaira anomala]|nr:hypothetical protein BD770DRAFT_379604 [Pilaira anomala]